MNDPALTGSRGSRTTASKSCRGSAPSVVKSALVGGVIERDNVFRWDAALDVVDVVEDVPAPGLEDLHIPAHIRRHLLRRRGREDVLRIATAAQNASLSPYFPFNLRASMFRALVWTGLRMSMPSSINSGRKDWQAPQV